MGWFSVDEGQLNERERTNSLPSATRVMGMKMANVFVDDLLKHGSWFSIFDHDNDVHERGDGKPN